MTDLKKRLRKDSPVVLSVTDWQAFYRALDKPPRPNKTLKKGFRWRRELRRT